MGRSGIYSSVFMALVVLLFLIYISGYVAYWTVPVLVIVGFLVLMALVPRTKQPEVHGEDKYHLHP